MGYSGREQPSDSGEFQELPGDLLSCLPSFIKSFPKGWNISIAKIIAHRSTPYPPTDFCQFLMGLVWETEKDREGKVLRQEPLKHRSLYL